MPRLRLMNAAEQVAEHLRGELISGRLGGIMPGVLRLEKKLGVNRNTLEAGLKLLEEEGLLIPQGAGRRRRIELPAGMKQPSLRVAILVGDGAERRLDYMVELQHRLGIAGHTAFFAEQTMGSLNLNVNRIAGMVKKAGADAWVVLAAPSEVLEWFCRQELAAFAVFGRRRELPLAGVGPNKPLAYAAAARELILLGHTRIVLMTRARRRLPEPGLSERAFLEELDAHGIPSGPYNLPDWEETVEGFHARLESLFLISPPTALIIDESPFFVAAQQFLARRGIQVPEDVSLVCTDASQDFEWCHPAISHIRWDTRPVVHRVLQWADNVSRGRKDTRQTETTAEFVHGGTIGPITAGRP